ncbi:DNRLRE domain-containing protein [Nonomuraea deserti]|uniref:DNRLRE domain-containing protein n=2 Tax=Bacteria TaxID=2 RepID=A0A4R4VJQ8_9ACTN|nr:DNRLRE domain-containing protein [Nonomuraea deserti]TDD05968.1 DNRLRE domain-containing protein [Nonomuraea deserti]
MRTKNLSLSKTKQGGLKLTTDKGEVLAAAPRPYMLDALVTQAERLDDASAPEVGDIDVQITGSELVLRPDPEFLEDPATTYPVTVDPAFTLPIREGRSINSPCPDGDLTTDWAVHVGLSDNNCSSNWSAKIFSRALLDFDTTSLAGQEVVNARLDLVGDLWTCPTGQQLMVQRITGAWYPNDVFWDNQPAVTDAGAVTSPPPAICNPASEPAANVPWSIAITDIAKSWATGSSGRGLMLRATIEDKSRPMFSFDFHDTVDDAPKLVVTYGAAPWVEHLRTVPVSSPTRMLEPPVGEQPQISGRLFTTTTRPTLQSGLRGTGATLRADFEIEHDPAATGQGSGFIWSGSAEAPAGEVAKLTVPEGTLQDGWRVRWRSRAVDGDVESAWSQWQPVSIDASRPQEPTVHCNGTVPEGAWRPRGEITCSVASASKDVTEYLWDFDNPVPSTIEEAGVWEDSLGETREIKETLGDGWHTLYVRTRDKAHNTSDVAAYTLGVGPGGIVTARRQPRTYRTVTLDASAPPARDEVTYEYTTSTMPWAEWSPVPTKHVFAAGSGTPIASWPQTRTDTTKDFGALSWDLAATLKASQEAEGFVQLRACFEGGSVGFECSNPIEVSLTKAATGDHHASSEMGPGSVALVNGDFALQATDAEVFGVKVARVHRTLSTEFDSTVPDEYKVFGPGWQVAFPAVPSWVAAYVPVDGSNKGWMQLIGPDGSTFTYTKNGDVYTGTGDAADGTFISVTDEQLTVTDKTGAKTTFVKVNGTWVVARTERPAAESAVTYLRDDQARITRVLTPAASGVQCGTTLVPGCRALELQYAAETTATGVPSGWGDYKGNVKSLSLTAFDPESNAMKTVTLAAYAYDSTGRLRQVTDPRSNVATLYYYTGEGRISQVTPPGLAPWRLEYDAAGRLAHAQRENGDQDPTWAVAYDVPVGGASAPNDLTLARTATWGGDR